MAKTINQVRKVNAKLGQATIDKYGNTFAVQFGLDGINIANVVVPQMPNQIKAYLEGDTTLYVYALADNINSLCNYALASFPNIKELYLFKNNGAVSISDNLSYLTTLRIMYVDSDYLSSYSWFTTQHSGYDTFTSVDDYVGYVVVYNDYPYIVTDDNKNNLDIVAGTTIAYDRYVTNIIEDYAIKIPYIADMTIEQVANQEIAMLTDLQKPVVTELIIDSGWDSQTALDFAWNYDFSELPNLNNNIWYNGSAIDFSEWTISGSGTLTSDIVDESISSIPSGKRNAITKLVIESTFTLSSVIDVTSSYNFNELPNLNNNIYYGSDKLSDILDGNYLLFVSPNPFTIDINKSGLEYSTDLTTWTAYTAGTSMSSVNNIFAFRGTNNQSIGVKFYITGSEVSCYGNVENLLDYQTVANGEHPALADLAFYELFRGCTALIVPPSIKVVEANVSQPFGTMFADCINLIKLPKLYLTTVGFLGCANMFLRCPKIKLYSTSASEHNIEYRIPYTGTFSSGGFQWNRYMFSYTGGELNGEYSVVANTTYYTSNELVD